MHDWLKLSHHSYSGQLRPHEHTSYLPLAALTLLTGIVLAAFSVSTLTAADHPAPGANSIGLTGTMPAPAPTVAATIAEPTNGQAFSDSPITIAGTCPDNTLVEIYKNDIFGGSSPCQNGKFSLQVDLMLGKNTLLARVYDDLNQQGPDSNTVDVTYNFVPPQGSPLAALNLTSQQLLLNTDAVFRGIFPGQTVEIPISIVGGVAPFAVSIDWGDGKTQVIPRGDNTAFTATHSYTKPGVFAVTIQVTDSVTRVAFLQVATIVNGQPSVTGSTATGTTPKAANELLVLWPLFAVAATAIISFWLGERREKRLLLHAMPAHA